MHDHIESYEQLELLLLLRNEPDAYWTEEALSVRLSIPSSLVSPALEELQTAGFILGNRQGSDKRYRDVAQRESLEATIGRLADKYREQPMPIIKVMSANAIDRVRTAALRTFASCCSLRLPTPSSLAASVMVILWFKDGTAEVLSGRLIS